MKARISVISPTGFQVEFETPEVKDRRKLLLTLPNFEGELLEAGYKPVSPGKVSPVGSLTPARATFLVDNITATVSDGKAYWRVKGGDFQKWGVAVYPEVLEAAGLNNINPLVPYTEPGLIAHYSLKEDGKPKKIVRLERREQ
ncbi:MAG: hypothetical protein HC875_07235 [Anaerolineales bacterium]|nr:hypothetical protein [Anaerolineales bacterium]